MRLLNGLKKIFHVQPAAFGCDISDRSIRLAFLKEDKGYLTLASFGVQSLPEGVLANGVVTDMQKAATLLRQSVAGVSGERIHTPYVVVSLPEPQSFLRTVQLPKLQSTEIAEALKWEIEANIPLPLSDVYYDWEIAPKGAEQDHLDILVAAAPKSLVDAYTQLFLQSGLKPIAFEVDVLAASRSVIPSGETLAASSMVVDIAYHRTTFSIYAGGLVRFTASVSVAGKDLAGADAKASIGRLADYARQYMDFFPTHAAHAHLTHADVRHVVLCGDDAHTAGLPSALALALGIPVAPANPWVNILKPPLHEVPQLPYKDSLGYTTALGLALRGYHEFATTP